MITNPIQRWLKSRTGRKFLRSRLAVAAMIVIASYLFVACAVSWFGAITLEQTLERVGSANIPGFFRTQPAEKRVEDCSLLFEIVERALDRDDPKAALAEIRRGRLRVADKSPDELRATVERGWKIYLELVESENLNEQPELQPQIAEIESVSRELFAPLEGADAWAQSLIMFLGTDRQGRSISLRAFYSIKVAIQIGLVTALISVGFGSLLGAAAAYFGGWVDHLVIWLYSTFQSIPNLVLLVLLAYMFTGTPLDGTLVPVYVAFCTTFWIGPCRVIRGETLKIKELEFVQAAVSIGFSRLYILVKHVLPNTAHLMLINFSLLFIGAIKSEVILSFLNLGVKKGPSWGIMISHSKQEVINGFFWQIGTATALMFVLVLAFNILTDSLQDIFDPKHGG